MKQSLAVLAVLFAILNARAFASDPGDSVFAGITVHTIKLTFSQTAYWDSLTAYYDAGEEQMMAATAEVDGTTYDSVGVRLKGNSSYSYPNRKKSLKLNFDEYLSAQRWDGLKGVHLNNMWGDPTCMREKLHLDFLHDAGIPAPRANFAVVYLNDTLWGLYSLVEHVDKKFLNTRYGDNSGDLFKAMDAFPGDTASSNYYSDFTWRGSVESTYVPYYDLKTDGSTTAWPQLVTLLDTVNNGTTLTKSFPALVNAPAFYNAMAADHLFANLDSYTNTGRNFYFYFNTLTGKMDWIVWDVGLSFGVYDGGLSSVETLSITYLVDSTSRPLLGKVLNTPSLKIAYLKTLYTLFTEHFTYNSMSAHIDSVANVIRSYVSDDPKKMYTLAQFNTNITSDITADGGGGSRKPGLKSFLSKRITSVTSQLKTLGITSGASASVGDVVINEFMALNDTIADSAGKYVPWIEVFNNTTDSVDVGGMFMSTDSAKSAMWKMPTKTKIAPDTCLIVWADGDTAQSGVHANFSLSGTGGYLRLSNTDTTFLDSVSYGAQTANKSMMRIPNGTGSFVQGTPTFATKNVLTSTGITAGQIVINEFMADNDSIANPDGNTNDWVELYNTTSDTLSLTGMYLSDNVAKPGKWQFSSGTTILPHGYLVIWADDDTTGTGLHATWKLSASGEQVCLSSTDLSILDSVTFGQQITNRSEARIPNGTGAFVEDCAPTIGAANGSTSGVSQASSVPTSYALSQNYPNPFNPTTVIEFALPKTSRVSLKVYNVLGQEVATLVEGQLAAGYHTATFDAGGVASGMYFYRIVAGQYSAVKKMMVLK